MIVREMGPHPDTLGDFRLHAIFGTGGMGEVWRATHVPTGREAAVKVLPRSIGEAPKLIDEFRREVQAFAALRHPRIVEIYDYGEIDGWPWFAMELVRGGVLGPRLVSTWEVLRAAILDILEALAHAHAHGVIHRDLKPGNLLRDASNDAAIKLTDFGIAHLMDADHKASWEVSSKLVGTPPYMAPEQFRGRFRDFGPWTDLYSLGCVAYALCAGHPPFTEKNLVRLAALHENEPIPPLAARFAVPPDFEPWLRKLTAKEPADRFECAADAAFHLEGLGAPVDSDESGTWLPPAGEAAPETADAWSETEEDDLPDTVDTDAATEHLRSTAVTADARRPVATGPFDATAPFPSDWRGEVAVTTPPTGLGLLGLREPPFVDRDSARDALWSSLTAVSASSLWGAGGSPALRDLRSQARAVVIRGAAGTGKSRLARWFTARALETGAATVLETSHSPGGKGTWDGFAGLLARRFRVAGLSVLDMKTRIRDQLPPEFDERDLRVILHLTEPALDAASIEELSRPSVALAEAGAVLRRLFEYFATRRPLIVWVDDAQWGLPILGLLPELLQSQSPILFVATIREEALLDSDGAHEALTAVTNRGDVQSLQLDALCSDDAAAMLHGFLPMQDDLAHRLVTAAAGNPLFAVQLAKDWAEQGALSASDGAFALQGEPPAIPPSIHELWCARIDHAIAAMSDPRAASHALGVAAVLGDLLDPDEWRAALRAGGWAAPYGLTETLVARGLLVRVDERLRFTHGLLRESLLRRVEDAGDLRRVHHACADAVSVAYRHGVRGAAGRYAEHSAAAGRWEDAIAAQFDHATELLRTDEYAEAERALRLLDRFFESAEIDPDEDAATRRDVLESRAARGSADFARALAASERAASRHPISARLRIEALTSLGSLVQGRSVGEDYSRAFTLLRRAVELAVEAGEPELEAAALTKIAYAQVYSGEPEAALVTARRAADLAETASSKSALPQPLYVLGLANRRLGRTDDAVFAYTAAATAARRAGDRWIEAAARNDLGDVLRADGRLADAAATYREAVRIFGAIGSFHVHSADLNLALLSLELGDVDDAHARITRSRLPSLGGPYRGYHTFAAMALAAAEYRFEDFEALAAEAEAFGTEGLIDPDLLRLCELSEQHLAAARQPRLAALARSLAATQRSQL